MQKVVLKATNNIAWTFKVVNWEMIECIFS